MQNVIMKNYYSFVCFTSRKSSSRRARRTQDFFPRCKNPRSRSLKCFQPGGLCRARKSDFSRHFFVQADRNFVSRNVKIADFFLVDFVAFRICRRGGGHKSSAFNKDKILFQIRKNRIRRVYIHLGKSFESENCKQKENCGKPHYFISNVSTQERTSETLALVPNLCPGSQFPFPPAISRKSVSLRPSAELIEVANGTIVFPSRLFCVTNPFTGQAAIPHQIG